MAADFRTGGLRDRWQLDRELDWMAAHMDHVITGVPAEYKKRNRSIQTYLYASSLAVRLEGDEGLPIGYTSDMKKWFRRHPEFTLETAFLHDDQLCPAPQPITQNCRLAPVLWGVKRWILNPADPGLIAYDRDRFQRMIAGGWDGIFLDEHASGDMKGEVCGPKSHTREYQDIPDRCGTYFEAVAGLLRAERAALGGKRLMINTSEYSSDYDLEMITAAGSGQLERMNFPFRETEPRWKFVDALLARGLFVDYATLEPDASRAGYARGNSPSFPQRWQLKMLANYYMVVPDPPDNLALDMPWGWKTELSNIWMKAEEVDLGKPLGPRRVYQAGTDGAGQRYRIYLREFERAYVLINPMIQWSAKEFGDNTAVEVPRPADRLVPLFADGSRGTPVSRIALRYAEAAILLKP